jgi:MFS family permease
MYFIFALTTRAVAGLGVSMGCSYGIAGIYFPTQISTVIALLELANGLGLTLGPPLGGLMYELGGFQFPFWFVGGFVFVLFLISFFLFPKIEKSKSIEKNEKETLSMFPLFKIPKYVFIVTQLFSVSLSLGFLGPSIQIHFKSLELSPTKLGLILFIAPSLYAASSPIVGYISDK